MDEIICHLGELEGSNSAIDETDPNSQLLALESQWTLTFHSKYQFNAAIGVATFNTHFHLLANIQYH